MCNWSFQGEREKKNLRNTGWKISKSDANYKPIHPKSSKNPSKNKGNKHGFEMVQQSTLDPSVVVHTGNPSTQEADSEKSPWLQGQPGLHSETLSKTKNKENTPPKHTYLKCLKSEKEYFKMGGTHFPHKTKDENDKRLLIYNNVKPEDNEAISFPKILYSYGSIFKHKGEIKTLSDI